MNISYSCCNLVIIYFFVNLLKFLNKITRAGRREDAGFSFFFPFFAYLYPSLQETRIAILILKFSKKKSAYKQNFFLIKGIRASLTTEFYWFWSDLVLCLQVVTSSSFELVCRFSFKYIYSNKILSGY